MRVMCGWCGAHARYFNYACVWFARVTVTCMRLCVPLPPHPQQQRALVSLRKDGEASLAAARAQFCKEVDAAIATARMEGAEQLEQLIASHGKERGEMECRLMELRKRIEMLMQEAAAAKVAHQEELTQLQRCVCARV